MLKRMFCILDFLTTPECCTEQPMRWCYLQSMKPSDRLVVESLCRNASSGERKCWSQRGYASEKDLFSPLETSKAGAKKQ